MFLLLINKKIFLIFPDTYPWISGFFAVRESDATNLNNNKITSGISPPQGCADCAIDPGETQLDSEHDPDQSVDFMAL